MSRTLLRAAPLAALLLAVACTDAPPGPELSVAVSPGVVTIDPLATQQFTATVTGVANQAVIWRVLEAGGGAVTQTGLYTAPATVGTYHVVAVSVVDATRTGTATVHVGTSGICTLDTPQPSALPATRVLELGNHTVGETVTFTIPPGTGSVTLLQQGLEQAAARTITWNGVLLDNTVIPLTVSVGGVLYFDDTIIPPDDPAEWGTPDGVGIGSIYSYIPSPWTGAMTIPNTTNALNHVAATGGVPSGQWSVVVGDYAAECKALGPPGCVVGDGVTNYPDGRYDLKVLLKQGVVGGAGTLPVNLYLVTDRYDATSAASSASMTRMRQTLAGYLAGAGLALGTVTFIDLPAAVKARYSAGVSVDDLSTCGDVATILQMSGPGNGMNLFLVNSLTSTQGGYTVVGQDGTIPGPASVGGTVASGALVSIEDLGWVASPGACGGSVDLVGCGADLTAYIAAHETGHFLGLYHVTESAGTLFDPVKDTPACHCSVCAPAAQQANCYTGTMLPTTYDVTNADCTKDLVDPASTCGGGNNLMFWLVDPIRSTGVLSAQQGSILRANPAVLQELP